MLRDLLLRDFRRFEELVFEPSPGLNLIIGPNAQGKTSLLTNTLLGHDGFVGVKTGSDDAAGGCFAFRAIRWIDGKWTTITGVVLGQPGHDQIAAGLAAADAMVDRVAGRSRRPWGLCRIYGNESSHLEPCRRIHRPRLPRAELTLSLGVEQPVVRLSACRCPGPGCRPRGW